MSRHDIIAAIQNFKGKCGIVGLAMKKAAAR
jgi:hypothetical protein